MCGIAGILNFNGEPVTPERLSTMLGKIKHRGPDSDDLYDGTPGGVGLAHGRSDRPGGKDRLADEPVARLWHQRGRANRTRGDGSGLVGHPRAG